VIGVMTVVSLNSGKNPVVNFGQRLAHPRRGRKPEFKEGRYPPGLTHEEVRGFGVGNRD
jgi:hypothetical protein